MNNFSKNYEHTIGQSSYEKSFGIKFVDEEIISRMSHNELSIFDVEMFKLRVIPRSLRYGFPSNLSELSVAVVGNGIVSGYGAQIDRHDHVIRISGMRNWQRNSENDGTRITLWAGHPAFVISDDKLSDPFEYIINDDTPLWALSPFHITCSSYILLRDRGLLEKLLVLPAPATLFDRFHNFLNPEEISDLYSIPHGRRQLTGLSNFELLLTGTRLILALEACRVKEISIFGFDLFNKSTDPIWFGHNIEIDRKIITGIHRRYSQSGRNFFWEP